MLSHVDDMIGYSMASEADKQCDFLGFPISINKLVRPTHICISLK